jgi:hypothetical protein
MKTCAILRSSGFITMAICWFSIQSGQAYSWLLNGPLTVARYDHTATLLPNGKVLIAGGYGANGVANGTAELYDPATGLCTLTGTMINARERHTATLLPNGKVLVTGGAQGFSLLTSSELYDPSSGTWTATGPLNVARFEHTATLLPGGKVLVAGGGSYNAIASAELYDPATGQWTSTPSMTTARLMHAATLLTNGLVLVTGGEQGGIGSVINLASAELYDPVSNIWRSTGTMLIPHAAHTATMLPSGPAGLAGTVLVAGGISGNNDVAACEIYSPATESWSSVRGMNYPRDGQTATVLPSGEVLVTGGETTTVITNTTEVFAPGTRPASWDKTASMDTPRMGHTATILPGGVVVVIGGVGANTTPVSTVETYYNWGGGWNSGTSTTTHTSLQGATLLPNGKVLIIGGNGSVDKTTDLYDPSTGSWTPTGSLNQEHVGLTSTLLQNGNVVVTGNLYQYSTSELEVYDSSLGTWADLGLGESNKYYTATLLLNGKVLYAGGYGNDTETEYVNGQCYLFDPATQTFSQTGSLNTPRYQHTATLLQSGKVLVAGGIDEYLDAIQSYELYDSDTGEWTQGTNQMTAVRSAHSATLLPNGKVLVAGGQTDIYFGMETSAELFDPVAQQWQATGSMNSDRSFFTMTLLPDGKVLAAGGMNDQDVSTTTNGATVTSELYDPVAGTWSVQGYLSLPREGASAVLVPNGQVFVVGGNVQADQTSFYPELFQLYLNTDVSRVPQITSSNAIVSFGSSLTLDGTLFSDLTGGSGGNGSADSPADYPVVQLRSIETGITTFLPCSDWGTNFFVSAPVTNFPAGYALATIFVNGIQSTSAIVQVTSTSGSMHIVLTNPERVAGGSFQFSFTNTPGASSRTFAETNISTPFNVWTLLGNPTEIAPGRFRFVDLQATNFPQRYYRVESP